MKQIDNIIRQYEETNQLIDALSLLEQHIFDNEYFAYRLIFNLWYILMEPDFDYLNHNPDRLSIHLKKIYNSTYEKYKQSPEYLFYTGYLISLSDWYFGIEEQKGISFIAKAVSLSPNNLLFKWGLCMQKPYDKNISSADFQLIKKSLQKHIDEYFKPIGLLDKYFRTIIFSK